MAITMAVCCFSARPGASSTEVLVSFLSFLVLEVGIGIYFPAISYLRSQVIPESHRANVMNWFRVPMNCITCGALLCLHVDAISKDKRIVFAVCLALSILGVLLCNRFIKVFEKSPEVETKPEEDKEAKTGLLSEA